MKKNMTTIALAIIFGFSASMLSHHLLMKPVPLTPNEHIFNYYKDAANTLVSPHSIRERMRHGENDSFILVDTRSSTDYLKEHVTTAINIDSSQTT